MKPTKIYTIGDYYNDNLSKFCHEIRRGNYQSALVRLISKLFAEQFPKNTAFVPVPSIHTMFNYDLASQFAKEVPNSTRCFCLTKPWCGSSIYDLKKNSRVITINTPLINSSNAVTLPPVDMNIILIDYVIGTGCTMEKCISLLQRPCEAFAIAVDWKEYNKHLFDEQVYK